jgi:hypothetical protein
VFYKLTNLVTLNRFSHSRYGITAQDVFRGVNDTTSAALRTGLLLSSGRGPAEKGTTCFMHAQELVLKHALGLTTCNGRGGQPDDEIASGNIYATV